MKPHEAAIKAAAERGLCGAEIAREVGVSPATVVRAAKRLGLTVRRGSRGGQNRIDTGPVFDLLARGESVSAVAARVGCHPSTVSGIKARYADVISAAERPPRRYQVCGLTAEGKPFGTIVRTDHVEDARARAMRAYPAGSITSIKLIGGDDGEA